MFRRLGGALLGLVLGVASLAPLHAGEVARVTYYDISDYSGTMRDGNPVYPGAFACPERYLGWTAVIVEAGVSGLCEDTGDPSYFDTGLLKIDVAAFGRPDWLVQDYYTVELQP